MWNILTTDPDDGTALVASRNGSTDRKDQEQADGWGELRPVPSTIDWETS